MSEFDDWKLEFGADYSKYSAEGYCIESAFKAGAQSQQSKIDELQARVDELQARVDEALYAADESCGVSVAAFIKLNRI